jgi:hypothetical protein
MNVSPFSDFFKINENISEKSLIKNIIDVLSVADYPLTVSEILSKLPEGSTSAKNPRNSVSTRMNEYSDNSNQRDKNKQSFFRVTSNNPLRFWLIDRMNELKEKSTKVTFIEAAQLILKQNNNKPMTSNEIWSEVVSQDLVETSGKTPQATMNAKLIYYSDNSTFKNSNKNSLFKIEDDSKPYKFSLINPNLEVQSIPDDETDESDEEFENKGQYSDEELKEKFTSLFGIKSTRLNMSVQKSFIEFLKILLSENRKFTREEIKKKLFENGIGTTEGQAGLSINKISQFLTKRNSDFIRQMISYDSIRWSPDAETDIGAKKDNYQIVDRYRKLISEVLSTLENKEDDEFKIQRFGQFGIPTDFKAAQAQEEREVKNLEPAVRNPFGGESKEAGDEFNSSSLFVVGQSGSGKSTRILSLLRKNEHKIILIGAENAPSPNLLLDYDQNEGYVPSDIAEFIISAKKDPKHFYTIVFDECHEYIDEIKRSILHAISTKRGEKRFFGVRKSVRNFFEDLDTYESTSKVIPDNVGFIFISSKPDVFEYHADFMGRVDKVEVKREDPYPYPDLKYIQSKIDRQDQL